MYKTVSVCNRYITISVPETRAKDIYILTSPHTHVIIIPHYRNTLFTVFVYTAYLTTL